MVGITPLIPVGWISPKLPLIFRKPAVRLPDRHTKTDLIRQPAVHNSEKDKRM